MDKDSLITKEQIQSLILERPRDAHKGNFGKILIIAGSKGMAGAAALCARGALRAGAGLVQISAAEEIFPILQVSIPEATCIDRKSTYEAMKKCSSIVIGPGMGDDEEVAKFVKNVLYRCEVPIIIDADALNCLKNDVEFIKNVKSGVVITPHPGEAARLLNISTKEVNSDRKKAARMLAEKSGAVTVLKGMGTIVADEEGTCFENTTGNPGMATGGSGDVLSGIVGSLLGQNLAPLDAAVAGVYLHGLAGDLGSSLMGEHGLMATDIANMTAFAIKKLGEK